MNSYPYQRFILSEKRQIRYFYIYEIKNHIDSIPEAKTSNITVIKLSRRKSLGSNIRITGASLSSNAVRQSRISNE
jgi:hypothetical protein